MKKLISILSLFVLCSSALAAEQIIRPYQSARSSGMGGVKLTTGLYDENFFGNPARITANPKNRFTILDPMVEASSSSIKKVGDLTGSGDVWQKLGDTAGDNNHIRIQTTMPALYIATGEGKWAYAFSLMTSTQFDAHLKRNYQISPASIVDVGPALTVGRKLLENDVLSVGATAHYVYRVATRNTYSTIDLIRGSGLDLKSNGEQGNMLNFDIGGTYVLPWKVLDFELSTALAMNNILGGSFSKGMDLIKDITSYSPREQPRTLGFGGAARKAELGPFTDFVFALEFSDIGNNENGSLFRTVHMGAEGKFGTIIPRVGINQGYLCAGLGLDFKFLTLDLGTYGEELSLNVGGKQERRYAFKLGLQI